jgi:hypothetical protein
MKDTLDNIPEDIAAGQNRHTDIDRRATNRKPYLQTPQIVI